MPQLFKKKADIFFRLVIVCVLLLVIAVIGFLYILDGSPYNTLVGVPQEQPVPFSHEHHVGGLGIDCRYCHTTVTKSSNAGMPAAEICMNCHSQIWNTAEMLQPIRESYDHGTPIFWRRIYDLPDFTYFNHSAHVNNGIGCEVCHGRVDQMPLLAKATSLKMEWCLNCHRQPEMFVRPLSQVTTMGWQLPEGVDAKTYGEHLVDTLGIRRQTDCYTCHR